MAVVETVKSEAQLPLDPGSPDKVKRERSAILFPYQDLGDAIKVAKGVHTLGGTKLPDRISLQRTLAIP
jgi:hypothetical protein